MVTFQQNICLYQIERQFLKRHVDGVCFLHQCSPIELAACEQTTDKCNWMMSTGFPQLLENLEKYWNFIILLKILEKWEWTWKNELSGKKIVLIWLLQHSFLLYRTLPIKMYIWEKFWDSWASVVFSDGRVYGAIRLGMLLDSKKGDRASAISCPQYV